MLVSSSKAETQTFRSGDPTVKWVSFKTLSDCEKTLKDSGYPCSIHHIDLSLSLLTKADLTTLSDLLSTHSHVTVTKLRLAYNSLGDDAGPAILALMQECSSSLEYLDLSYNNFTDIAIGFIASGCVFCSKLRRLYLQKNNIGDAGVQCLIAAKSQNAYLQLCDIRDNVDISTKSQSELVAALSGNFMRRTKTFANQTLEKCDESKTGKISSNNDDDNIKIKKEQDRYKHIRSSPLSRSKCTKEKKNSWKHLADASASTSLNSQLQLQTNVSKVCESQTPENSEEQKQQVVLNLFNVLTLSANLKHNATQSAKRKRSQTVRRRFIAAARAFIGSTAMLSDMHFRQKLLGKQGLQEDSTVSSKKGCICLCHGRSQIALETLFAVNTIFCTF